MQEYVFAAVVRSDKSVAACMIELQYPASSQLCRLRPEPVLRPCLG
jgi:hypothetical protein